MTRWRCTVCDFISEGEAPPDICPVCGAPKSAFEKIDGVKGQVDLKELLRNLHLHPILSHFTNGLIPVAVLFIGIYFITGNLSFEKAAFYVYITAILITPLTFGAGLLDWYLRYNSVTARIFTEKIILSLILIPLSLPVIYCRFSYPDILVDMTGISWIYIAIIFIQTGVVTRLGYLGGKLIFS